jgi:N-acylneuraminate cytidylyltransferase
MSAVAIILARSGSKRIPGKNLRLFLEHPVIHYPIRAAIESGCFDEVMVSTDDEQIASIARASGAVTPFKRSAENANDHATTTDALLEVIAHYRAAGREFDFVCGMYASAPLISADHLRAGWEIIQKDPKAQTVMPVIRYGHPVQRAFVADQGQLKLMMPEFGFTRSQDLPVTYHDAGQWYWMRVADFERGRKVFADRCLLLELSELEVQDIDNEVDWRLAELKARIQKGLQ